MFFRLAQCPVDQDADNANTGSSAGGSSTNANREASARGDAALKYGYGQTVTTEQDNSYVTEVNGTLAGLSGQNQNLISGYLNSRSVEDKTFAGIGNNGSTTATAGDVTVKATEKRRWIPRQVRQVQAEAHPEASP